MDFFENPTNSAMPKFTVEKSIEINVSIEKAHTAVRDFKQWPTWSPWLIADPDCSVEFPLDGMSYSWIGKIAGSGNMVIIEDDSPNHIGYQLTFLSPWKSVSKVSFNFESKGNATEVTWKMDGSLPFFMFWMKGMMGTYIGMDFDRGLAMLKDFCETGNVPSKLSFSDDQAVDGFSYIGISKRCTIEELGETMKNDFSTLGSAFESKKITASGKAFSIYHKYDLSKGVVEYTIGIPITSPPSSIPPELTPGDFRSCNTYAVEHLGPYRHLGNAWSGGIMHTRAKVFKQARGIHPFEVYHNNPNETPENELLTTVHFPKK